MFVAHSEIAVLWGKRSLKKARSGCGSRGISAKGDWMEVTPPLAVVWGNFCLVQDEGFREL